MFTWWVFSRKNYIFKTNEKLANSSNMKESCSVFLYDLSYFEK